MRVGARPDTLCTNLARPQDEHHRVDMIRHDDERVQGDLMANLGSLVPLLGHDFPEGVEAHHHAENIAKQGIGDHRYTR
jgi:hypothetical protein